MSKKNMTVTLYVSELVYDVQNKTYLTGRSRAKNGNYEEVANMQANDDDDSKFQILRSIANAYANLKTKLSEYIEESTTSVSNKLEEHDTITFSLVMPSNFNQATNDTVAAAAHKYLVNNAVADWFVITNKADAGEYYSFAAANIEEIREAINKRVRPIRSAL